MEVVAVTLASTLCMQLGFFLWKLSADRQPRIGRDATGHVVKALLTDWRWLTGTLASTCGWILFVRAASIGEISVVQPLMSTGDLVLVALAVVVLGERLGARESVGLAVTIAGAVLLALGAVRAEAPAWTAQSVVLFVLASGLVAGTAMAWARSHPAPEVPLALAIGACFGAAAVMTKAWTADVGLGWAALAHPLFAGLLAANVLGLVLLQAAFQRGRASVIVPVQLAIGNAVAVAGGVWLFGEELPPERLLAIALIVAGAAMLQQRSAGVAPAPQPRSP